MGNLVFGSGAEPGSASKARGGLTESPMERDYDATESERERYTELIFVDPAMKVNGQYYRDVLLSQQMLPAIKPAASDTFVFQQDNAPSHRASTPLNSYRKKRRTSLVLISGHQTDRS